MSSSPVRGFSGAPPRGGGAAPRGGGAAPRGGFGARGRGGPPPRGGGFRGGPPRGRGRGAFAGQPSMAPTTVTPELVKRMDALDLDGHTTTSVELAPPTAAASTSTTSTSSSTSSSSSSSGSPLLTVSSPSAGSPHEEPATSIAKKRLSKIVVEDAGSSDSRGTSALDVEGLVQTKSAPGKKVGIGNMWAQRMEAQQNEDFQRNRDKLRTRRKGGVAFMDTQIRNLIVEIKRLSSGPGSGMASVTFGVLFKETIDSMPALAATLACAQKRGVVTYSGDMLMQGTSDGVVITLIKDTIEDTADFKSVIGTGPIKLEQKPSGPEKCDACAKTVYPTERIAANGKVMHKPCFRCCTCKIILKLSAYAFNGGKFYCENHFQQMFKQSGYNF